MGKQLPKNVRQIGNVSDSTKIYVEDYVDTFFNQLCDKAEQEMLGAFLVGEKVHEEEQDYIYIYGAIHMKELVLKGKDFIVTEQVWKHALEKCKEFFGDAEILGWFVVGGDHPLEINHNINKIHQRYFGRENSVFVTKNVRDKEEKFYVHKYKDLMECGGHYIYYEKNIEMQNYMISTRKKVGFTPSEIIEDRVTKNFRNIIREKNEKNEQKSHSRMVYAASTFLVLVIVIIGVTMLNNYDKMQNIQNPIDTFANNQSEEKDDDVVEAMGENVTSDTNEQDKPSDDTTQIEEPPADSTQTVPETPPADSTQPPVQTQEKLPEEPRTYVVEQGDTLESISREKYGDANQVDEICKLNNLNDGNLIYIGQKLLLP